MREKLRELGLRVKSGSISEIQSAEFLAGGLLSASENFNVLAESYNHGSVATNATWHSVLTSLRSALERIDG
jgi:hypothetical protein